ncbi:MAG TPA: hypothetical protein VKB34_01320 [Povalibacter sp.]|nr:hypothetical protein [Povalibacter sp.]
MADEPRRSFWHTFAGVLTAAGAAVTAITGLIVALRHEAQAPAAAPTTHQEVPTPAAADTATVSPAVQQQEMPIEKAPRVVGTWQDNWGTVTLVTQNGSSFQYTAVGTSCLGPFRSSGSGTINGANVRSRYESTLPSEGTCSGTLSADGQELTSTCSDSVCGTFVSTSVRQ